MDEILPLMQARDSEQGERVCELLRAAGIKCNHSAVPDENSATAWLTGFLPHRDVVEVFVRESDMDKARQVVQTHEAHRDAT